MYAFVVGSLVRIEHTGVLFNDVFEEIYYEEYYFLIRMLFPLCYFLLGVSKKNLNTKQTQNNLTPIHSKIATPSIQ